MFTNVLMAMALTAGIPAADPAKGATNATAPAPVAKDVTGAQDQTKPTRYCIRDVITGSRLPVKVCRTRADWLNQGFDPLASGR